MITIVSLFALNTIQSLPISYPEQYVGTYGQLCPLPPPNAILICSNTSPTFGQDKATEQAQGYTQCIRIGDCCGCASISCGNDTIGCNTFIAGDYGAFGVENINIFGDIQDRGAAINCFGNEACAGTVIRGGNISTIHATNVDAMKNAQVTITNPVDGFGLYCIGEGSCENSKFELIIAGPPQGFVCNPSRVSRTIIWDGIVCYGENSCKNMDITINNMGCDNVIVGNVGCYGASACLGTAVSILGEVNVDNCDLVGTMPIAYERFMNENTFCVPSVPSPVVNRAVAMGPNHRPSLIRPQCC